MVSYNENGNEDKAKQHVLILVVMEDGLVLTKTNLFTIKTQKS